MQILYKPLLCALKTPPTNKKSHIKLLGLWEEEEAAGVEGSVIQGGGRNGGVCSLIISELEEHGDKM